MIGLMTKGKFSVNRLQGELFNDSFARASIGSDYAQNGPATWACNGSALTVTGGTGSATSRLRYVLPHSSEKNTQVVVAQITSVIGTTTFGFGPGFYDLSSPDGESSVFCRLITNNNSPDFGKFTINTWDGTTSTARVTSASALTINQNDVFTYTMTKSNIGNAARFDVTITRAAGGSISANWSEVMTSAGIAAGQRSYSTAYYSLYSIGGDFTITNWNVNVTDKQSIHALFIGDSITHGLYATDLSTRWATQVGNGKYGSFEISAGSGDVTQRVLDKIVNVTRYYPRHVFLMIGGNDVLFGVAQATYEANYMSIRTQLKAAGVERIFHCLATPRDANDMTTLNTFISGFTADTVIDTFTPLKGAGTDLSATYDNGDGVHPNQAGHDLIASTILAAI